MELSRDGEVKVLSILRKRRYWNKYCSIIKPNFFSEEHHKHLFSLFQKYFDRYHKARKITISDMKLLIKKYTKNENRKVACIQIADDIKHTNIQEPKFIEDTVSEFCQRQIVKTIVMEGLDLLEQDEMETSKLKDYFNQIDLIKGASGVDYYDYLAQNRFRIEREKKTKRLETGIEDIDHFLRGGLEAGELCVILAPPERGKTLMMVNIGAHALEQGKLVYHSTHEINAEKVAQRYDQRITKLDPDELMRNPEDLHKALRYIKANGGELVIQDYADREVKLDELRASIVAFTARRHRKPDLIIIDYADLISSGKGLNDRFELKAIYTNLRRMAQGLRIPLVTGSQGNRKSMDKILVTMKDFSEDISKAAIADIVITLCQTPEEEEDKMMRLHIAKNRRRPGHPTFRVACEGDIQFIGSFQDVKSKGFKDNRKSIRITDKLSRLR